MPQDIKSVNISQSYGGGVKVEAFNSKGDKFFLYEEDVQKAIVKAIKERGSIEPLRPRQQFHRIAIGD